VGDFGKALEQVIAEYDPDRVIIEPSGVGKLSDVIGAVKKVTDENVTLGYTVAVCDAGKVKVYMKNFGEFYNNQIETASTIILSRTDSVPQNKLDASVALIREHNDKATVVTTPWNQLTGAQLLEAMEGQATLAAELAKLEAEHKHHHHHEHEEHCGCGHHDHEHHHHEHGEECCCGHHDHEHHHHEHGEECCCGHHDHEHHHHEHGEHCSCGHDHHHHHADEVFTSWGVETHKKFSRAYIEEALKHLDSGCYGIVLRAKGILECADGGWIHFDMVPEEYDVREGGAAITGKLCVIGSQLDEKSIAGLFGV
jgi:G3E family GTPase